MRMRCLLGALVALVALTMVLWSPAAYGAALPTTITLVPEHVVIENCVYASGATLGNLDGSGVLKLKEKLNGVAREYSLGSVQLKTLGLDSSGNPVTGSVKVGSVNVENFLGSGFRLEVTQANVAPAPGSKISAELVCNLESPFNDQTGRSLRLHFSGNGGYMRLTADQTGSFQLTGSEGQAVTANGNQGVLATGGVVVKPGSFPSLALSVTEAGGPKFTLACASGTASVSIPELVTYEGTELPLKFTALEVNEAGEITATGMTLKEPTTIALANPSDFFLDAVSANVSLDHGALTKYDLQAHVALPQALSPSAEYRNKINNVQFDLMKHAVVELPQTMRVPDIPFNGYKLNSQSIVLDFSREGPDDLAITPGITGKSWQGIYAKTGTVTMPSDWTANGQPVVIPVKSAFLESDGVSCAVEAGSSTLGSMELGGFNCHLNELKLEFRKNDLVDSKSSGSVSMEGLGKLNLDVKVANAGTTVTVTEGQSLNSAGLGMTVNVDGGSLIAGTDGVSTLWLNGSIGWSVPECPGLSDCLLSFHDLGIDRNFNFVFNSNAGLSLDSPVDADFGIFKCNISSVALLQDGGQWVADFDGELSLNSDLPVTGTITFDRLRVYAENSKPAIALNGLALEAEVQNVVRINAMVDKKKVNGRDRLSGAATLALTMAGDSEPMKGSFELVVEDDGVWGVAGKAYLPTPIQIGTTPLAFYAFKGGVAHNMTAPEGFQSVNELVSAPGSGKWLLMGGCDVGVMDDPRLFYAEAALSVGLPQFIFDLRGNAWILSEDRPAPAPLQVSATLDPTVPSFRVGADVNLNLPPGYTILNVAGGMELLLSPSDTHLAIGQPYPDAAVGCNVLGLWNARFGLLATPTQYTCSAGSSFSLWPLSGAIDGTFGYNFTSAPYLTGRVAAWGEVDFYVASLGASAELSGQLFDDGMHCDGTFRAKIGMPWPIPDISASVGMSVVLP